MALMRVMLVLVLMVLVVVLDMVMVWEILVQMELLVKEEMVEILPKPISINKELEGEAQGQMVSMVVQTQIRQVAMVYLLL